MAHDVWTPDEIERLVGDIDVARDKLVSMVAEMRRTDMAGAKLHGRTAATRYIPLLQDWATTFYSDWEKQFRRHEKEMAAEPTKPKRKK